MCLCAHIEVGARSHIAVSEYGKLEFGGCCLIDVSRGFDPLPSPNQGIRVLVSSYLSYRHGIVIFLFCQICEKRVSKSNPNVLKEETISLLSLVCLFPVVCYLRL